MKRRIRVGVLFGGQSGEHEVSLASATSVIEAMEASGRYEIVPIGIRTDRGFSTRALEILSARKIGSRSAAPEAGALGSER
jgi:D-alanine-D-alanine ligase